EADIVASSVQSLRLLDSQDWESFFEEVNLVHSLLAHDPAGIYLRMDFATRNRYREVVEKMAQNTGKQEQEIAALAVELASAALAAEDALDGVVPSRPGRPGST